MKHNVSDSDIILCATTCKSMRDGARLCGLEATTFCRRAKKLGVYDRNRWKNECKAKAEKKELELQRPKLCRFCGKECKNNISLSGHERLCLKNPNRNYVSHTIGCKPWNAGLTKSTDERIRQQGHHLSERYKNHELIPGFTGKKHSDETKRKLSEAMKLAQKEGRAHNIGECRWNNTHSWPEKWLIQVLKNECCYVEGIHYVTEYPFHRFSLDFAFVNSKLCIEVDGKQHTTDKTQIERDKRKDELLREDGWKELRIPWRECFSNPKTWIDKIKSFLREYNTMASIGDS